MILVCVQLLDSLVKVKVLVVQSCLTLGPPGTVGLPGFFVHGILQARTLEWVATPSPGKLGIKAYLQGFAESVFDDGRG